MSSSKNDFSKAVDLLQSIISIEENNLDMFKPILTHSDNSKVTPKPPATEEFSRYSSLKREYQEVVLKILDIRKGFTQKLMKDCLPTLSTQQEEISEHEVDDEIYKTEGEKIETKWIDFRRDYIPKLIIITCLSLSAGLIMGVIIFFHDFYNKFGMTLVASKS